MISTGGTIEAAARRLLEEGASRVVVAATHGLFVGPARDRLAALPVERVIVSESLPQRADLPFALDVVSLAPLLAGALRNGA
jgi:ribose-phosphate pyrophosphokinase